jgi:hypothetical protein
VCDIYSDILQIIIIKLISEECRKLRFRDPRNQNFPGAACPQTLKTACAFGMLKIVFCMILPPPNFQNYTTIIYLFFASHLSTLLIARDIL